MSVALAVIVILLSGFGMGFLVGYHARKDWEES